MKGRKPKPTALKVLEGERADRVNDREPLFLDGPLDPPDWLQDEAVEHWLELAPMLAQAGLLTEGDRFALAALCDDYRLFRLDPLDAKARDRYRRMLVEFGLTPSSRSRIKAGPEKPKDDLEEFLAG